MTGIWEENDWAEYRDIYTGAYTGRGIYANATHFVNQGMGACRLRDMHALML